MAGLIYDDVLYSSGGEANVIESISVNNSPVAPANKNVNINIPAVSVSTVGTASSTVVCKQQITIGNNSYDINGTAYMEQDVLLSTSDSTIATFTNSVITANSCIDPWISDWSIVPENVSASSGTCAVTLPKVDTAATVRVRIYIR